MRGFTINHPQNVIAEARELSLDELQNIAGGNGLNPKDILMATSPASQSTNGLNPKDILMQ
jgi:hypothetical protein